MNDFIFALFEWTTYGYIIGIIINLLDREEIRYGVIGTTIFGILGAVFGGLYVHFVFGMTIAPFSFHAFLATAAGAIIVGILQRFAFRSHNQFSKWSTPNVRNKYFLSFGG